jgi:hypothetical protein
LTETGKELRIGLGTAVMSILVMTPVASIVIKFSYRKLRYQAEPSTRAAVSATS